MIVPQIAIARSPDMMLLCSHWDWNHATVRFLVNFTFLRPLHLRGKAPLDLGLDDQFLEMPCSRQAHGLRLLWPDIPGDDSYVLGIVHLIS